MTIVIETKTVEAAIPPRAQGGFMPQDVDFFFDFVSPYTYLAQTQLPALKERTGARFRLWPMHLLNS
jgi:2-hydroxychromene-2-carboxylate isomerase